MPRKRKQPRAAAAARIPDVIDEGMAHDYVEGDVPDGHDVPVFDVYFEFSDEDFEEKMRKRIRIAELQRWEQVAQEAAQPDAEDGRRAECLN